MNSLQQATVTLRASASVLLAGLLLRGRAR
jgi:hypothetical protein